MSDISRWDLRSDRVGDNNVIFFMDRSKDGPWVSYGDAVFALDAKDALLREAEIAMQAAERLYQQGILDTPNDEIERVHTLRRALLLKLTETQK